MKWPDHPSKLSDVIRWSLATPNLGFVKEILDAYPRAMTDPFLSGREPTCQLEPVIPADFDYTFVVPVHICQGQCSV